MVAVSELQITALPLGVLLVCLGATLFMTGVIWVIQVVHYPLFAQVGDEFFPGFHSAHTNRITFVVLPPMVAEALTALLLVFVRPPGLPAWAALAGLMLVGVVWGSTFALQVPHHGRISGTSAAEDRAAAIGTLVTLNWIRTAAWTTRSVLMLMATAAVIVP